MTTTDHMPASQYLGSPEDSGEQRRLDDDWFDEPRPPKWSLILLVAGVVALMIILLLYA